MARNHRDVQPDLVWLDRLPGTKVLSAGNHDAWWNGVGKVRPLLRRSLLAVGGDALATHGVIVCGTLAMPVPTDEPDPAPNTLWDREIGALREGARLRRATAHRRATPLCPMALPPLRCASPARPLRRRLESEGVTACIYGHIHIEGQWSRAVQGESAAFATIASPPTRSVSALSACPYQPIRCRRGVFSWVRLRRAMPCLDTRPACTGDRTPEAYARSDDVGAPPACHLLSHAR